MKNMAQILPRFRTIKDMQDYYYSALNEEYLKKQDAPIISTTVGVYNALYGRQVWQQIIQEANAFGILPKKVWDKSGWRVITAAGATSGGGVAENAALPDTVKPTWAEVETKPKSVATTFNVSQIQQILSLSDDGLGDMMAFMRQYSGEEHVKLINRMLLANVTDLPVNDIESLDRIVSSYAEVTNCADVNAGDSDIYGLDRDAAPTWADAYVNHNGDTDRDLTLSLLDTLFQNTRQYWSKEGMRVLLTGADTLERIQQLLQSQQRFAGDVKITPSIYGVKVEETGVAGGFMVATYRGIPIIVSDDVVQDTISRVYLFDTGNLFMKVAAPTRYYQSGITSGDPFGTGALNDEGLYVTVAELICTLFKAQGKIRDLQ